MKTDQVFDKHMPQHKFLTRVVNSAIFILALIMFIAGMYPSASNWGVNHLAFYSSTMQFIIPMLMLLLLIPSVRCFLIKRLERIVIYFGKQKKHIRYRYALVVLVASGVLFWIARTATHFLGDGYTLLAILKGMGSEEFILNPGSKEPLTNFLVLKLKQLFSALGSVDSAEAAYRAYSISFGILFMVVVWKLTGFISKERIERVLIFLFLLASGTSQLFFGYIENYALAYCMIFLFILASVSYLQRATSIIYPAIIFPVLVSAYFATIIFLPALLLLMWVCIRRKEIKAIILASISALTLTAGLMWMLGYTPAFLPKVFGGTDNPIIPFTKATAIYQSYTFFSVGHAIDLLNLFFLVQPTAVVLLFAGGWLKQKQENKTDEKVFLVLMIVFGVIFVCIITCWLGMNRDWDALSVFSSGISVAAVYGWFYDIKQARIRRELLAAVIGVALIQTGLWIGINADETSALQRMDILKDDPRLSEIGVCAYAEARGKYHWVRKEYAKAAKCYERAVALEPNYRFLSQLASMNNAMNQYSKSIEIYKRMEALGQADGKIYSNMGILYLQSQQYDNALKYLHMAEALDSLSPHIPLHIGTAIAIREHSYEKGLPYFLKAIKLDPSYAIAYHNASICYKDMGDTVMAQKFYERYSELNRTQTKGTGTDISNLF